MEKWFVIVNNIVKDSQHNNLYAGEIENFMKL